MLNAQRLAILLAGMGVLHFVAPKPFDAIVPKELPGDPRAYTYASGVAELGVAATLAAPRTRRFGGLLAALLFIAVFPANIQMAVDWVRSSRIPMVAKVGVVLRLPLQIPLILAGLRVYRQSR